jgi:hypothetical protein
MPSAITVGAVGGVSLTTRRPSTLGVINANALGGRALTQNVLAVVGEFPWLDDAVPTRYNSDVDMINGAPVGNVTAATVAKFVYQQADPKVAGQPLATYLVNTAPTTPSLMTLLDASANDAVKLTSRVFGYDANQIVVTIVANAVDSSKRDITLTFKGQTETFTSGSGTVASFEYTGTDATTVAIDVRESVTDTELIQISQTRTAVTGAFVPSEGTWLWDGIVTATPSIAPTPEDGSLLITGVLKTGVASTETITLPAGLTAPVAGIKEWSAITVLNYTPSSAAETCTVAGDALVIGTTAGNTAQFPTLVEVADYLNQFSAQGWVVTKDYPALASIPLNRVDQVLAGDMVAAAVAVSADVWWLANLLETSSTLVSATQLNTGISQTPALAATAMAGGTYSAASSSDVATALQACRTVDIQTFVLLHEDQPSQEALRSHCTYMAGQGAGECDGWVATATTETFTSIKTRAKALNTRHLSLVSQDVTAFSPTGASTSYAPKWLAVMLGGMQCSTAVGTPLTRKRPLVNAVATHSSWDADIDAEEALENGLVILTTDRLGLRVERSVTTYLTDDNPVFSEKSSNESLNTCIRDLRRNLDTIIGDPAVDSTRNRVKALAKARLLWQVENNVIKAFDTDSLAVDDYGDYYRVRFRVAPVEPTNWIVVEATASRTPFNA